MSKILHVGHIGPGEEFTDSENAQQKCRVLLEFKRINLIFAEVYW